MRRFCFKVSRRRLLYETEAEDSRNSEISLLKHWGLKKSLHTRGEDNVENN